MNYVAMFFAGAFLCNGIPHLAAGLRGESFPTPFAKPRGVGLSSPFLNFIWGLVNGLLGAYLLHRHGMPAVFSAEALAMLAGFFLLGTYLSRHFGKIRNSQAWN